MKYPEWPVAEYATRKTRKEQLAKWDSEIQKYNAWRNAIDRGYRYWRFKKVFRICVRCGAAAWSNQKKWNSVDGPLCSFCNSELWRKPTYRKWPLKNTIEGVLLYDIAQNGYRLNKLGKMWHNSYRTFQITEEDVKYFFILSEQKSHYYQCWGPWGLAINCAIEERINRYQRTQLGIDEGGGDL